MRKHGTSRTRTLEGRRTNTFAGRRTKALTGHRAWAALAAAGALALSGCGSDPKQPTKPADGPSPAAATVVLPRLDGEKLEVAAVWTGQEQANFVKVLKEFERRTGATVTFVPAQDPIVTFLGSKIAGGAPPDVALLPQVGALVSAVKNKWAQPVGTEAQAQLDKNYSNGWKSLGAVDGAQYGVYYKAANKSLIWYNAKAFEAAGVTPPRPGRSSSPRPTPCPRPGPRRSRWPAPTAGP